MASLNSVGLAGILALRRSASLPIHAHRNGWGYLSRDPLLGWSYAAWSKIWRLAGVDHMHVNGLANKFSESNESVFESARSCLTPMFEQKPCAVMPVFSSGQTARQAPGTYQGLGSVDLIFLAGGGILAHPGGPARWPGVLTGGMGGGRFGNPSRRLCSRPRRPRSGARGFRLNRPGECRLIFYGDDFTGSTDALEVLTFAGLRSALFLKPPQPETLAQFAELDAAGVAGDSRAMSPAEMSAALPAVFEAIATVGAPIVHYKVCSTFDSSPSTGSIGRILEIARRQFDSGFIPIVAETPALARYCLFGNLFARSGTDGKVYRIDRHPIMSAHPVTPMTEGDLALHLERQGEVVIEKFPYPWFEEGRDAALGRLSLLGRANPDAILFDSASPPQLSEIGYLLVEEAKRRAPIFVVGGSGVEYALTQFWRESEKVADTDGRYNSFAPADRLLAVSGSASKLTAAQIEAGLNAGFAEIRVVASDLLDDELVARRCRIACREGGQIAGAGPQRAPPYRARPRRPAHRRDDRFSGRPRPFARGCAT